VALLGGLAVVTGVAGSLGSVAGVPEVVEDVPGIDVNRVAAADLSSAAGQIDTLISRIKSTPDDGLAYRDLGHAFIQWFRETADPSLLDRADKAFQEARRRLGDDPMVLVGEGALLLSRHDFAKALEVGRRAVDADDGLAAAHAVVVDALVELGRYEEAITAAGRLEKLSRGELPTLARASYIRELHGDLEGALDTMRRAALYGSMSAPPENVAFVMVIVGNLQVATGKPDSALGAYDLALERFPNFPVALAAKGRLAVGRGDLEEAAEYFERASAVLPLPEYVIALGEVQEAAGLTEASRDSYALARAQSQLFQASGVIVDLELALFEADHGDAQKALEFAEAAYASRPNVKAADALAWALFKTGRLDEAEQRIQEALRIGTRDPLMLYHAGAIAGSAGRDGEAVRYLTDALSIDAGWSATGAADARRILSTLP
jgi:tetratricopeptide (TPR) repeat protein